MHPGARAHVWEMLSLCMGGWSQKVEMKALGFSYCPSLLPTLVSAKRCPVVCHVGVEAVAL